MPTNKPNPDIKCHETGFKKTCLAMHSQCPKWVSVTKQDKEGNQVDDWMCADTHTPILLVELIKIQSQTRSSVDKVANEVTKSANQNPLDKLLMMQPPEKHIQQQYLEAQQGQSVDDK